MNYIDDEIIDEDSDSDYIDTVDSHLNFSVPDSYVEIKSYFSSSERIIMEDKIILLILKIFKKIVSIIEIIIKKTKKQK